MRLAADWVHSSGTLAVFDALSDHDVWFVGGCVRDALLGRTVDDIDLCTTARPEQVMALAEAAGLKSIPTGLDHGTVTLMSDGQPYEITTLRRDLETDGRHATVAFSTRIEDDAARRDFTMNALYATRDGTLVDPTGQGLTDLRERRVRFIGTPADRIAEDYLRILRFFRFHAWYADPERGIDAEGLAASAAGLDGLAQLSRERIGAEMRKLLSAPDPAPAVASMAHAGVLPAILPGAEAKGLLYLIGNEGNADPDPIRRLAALGGEDIADRLRLSNAEATRLTLYRTEISSGTLPGELGYRHGADPARDILSLRCALLEGRPPAAFDLADVASGAKATFPVKAADLMPSYTGPELGTALRQLETTWIASGFAMDKDALLATLPKPDPH